MKKWHNGTGVALVTPFQQGKVDFPALERLINHCINGGLEYLVALGTTGETPTLSTEERNAVLDFVIEKTAKRVPVVAGFGGNNTQAIIEQLKARDFEGVDAILSSSPSYNKPSQEGIYQHYMALAEVAPRPIILYNVPGRTSSNMSADTTLRLAHSSDKFIAIKEASGDLAQCMRIIKNKPTNFSLVSGDDNLTLPLLACGAAGVISVVGNAFPKSFSDMVRAGVAGDFETARALHYQLLEILDLLFVDGNPAGVKAALEILGICDKEQRLPLVDARPETYQAILQRIKRHEANLAL